MIFENYPSFFGKSQFTDSNEIMIHEKKKTSHFTFHEKKIKSFRNHENTLYHPQMCVDWEEAVDL